MDVADGTSLVKFLLKAKQKISEITQQTAFLLTKFSNMKADDASFDEIQNAYYEHSFHKMEEEVAEWIEEIFLLNK